MAGASDEVSDERVCFLWCSMVRCPAQVGKKVFTEGWVDGGGASQIITKVPFLFFCSFLLPPPSSDFHGLLQNSQKSFIIRWSSLSVLTLTVLESILWFPYSVTFSSYPWHHLLLEASTSHCHVAPDSFSSIFHLL